MDGQRSGNWRFWGGWGLAFVGFPQPAQARTVEPAKVGKRGRFP